MAVLDRSIGEVLDDVILAHMQGLLRQELAMIRAKATEQSEAGLLLPGVTVEGVPWLFTAIGMLVAATVALNWTETCTGIDEAAGLFDRIVGAPGCVK